MSRLFYVSAAVFKTLLVLALLSSDPAYSQTRTAVIAPKASSYYVEKGATGDGTTPSTPAPTISFVLQSHPLKPGDKILVAPTTPGTPLSDTFSISQAGIEISRWDVAGSENEVVELALGATMEVRAANVKISKISLLGDNVPPDDDCVHVMKDTATGADGSGFVVEDSYIDNCDNAAAFNVDVGVEKVTFRNLETGENQFSAVHSLANATEITGGKYRSRPGPSWYPFTVGATAPNRAQDVLIQDAEFFSHGAGDIFVGGAAASGDNVRILNNRFYNHNGKLGRIEITDIDSLEFRGNYLDHPVGGGVILDDVSGIVTQNSFRYPSVSGRGLVINITDGALKPVDANGITISNNEFLTMAALAISESVQFIQNDYHVVVVNNTFSHPGFALFVNTNLRNNGDRVVLEMYNNIFFTSGSSFQILLELGNSDPDWSNYKASHNHYYNDNPSGAFYIGLLYDLDAYKAITGEGEQSFFEDPRLVNPDIDNVHLLSGSPCIDSADSTKAPATDFSGQPRDAQPDRGAWEYRRAALGFQ